MDDRWPWEQVEHLDAPIPDGDGFWLGPANDRVGLWFWELGDIDEGSTNRE